MNYAMVMTTELSSNNRSSILYLSLISADCVCAVFNQLKIPESIFFIVIGE